MERFNPFCNIELEGETDPLLRNGRKHRLRPIYSYNKTMQIATINSKFANFVNFKCVPFRDVFTQYPHEFLRAPEAELLNGKARLIVPLCVEDASTCPGVGSLWGNVCTPPTPLCPNPKVFYYCVE